jgi:hypothetical protein
MNQIHCEICRVETTNSVTQLDAIDVEILDALQAAGRLSNVELAQQRASVAIGLPAAREACSRTAASFTATWPCSTRAPSAARAPSYTIINLENTQPKKLEAFEQAVRDQPADPGLPLCGRQQRLPGALHVPRRGRP